MAGTGTDMRKKAIECITLETLSERLKVIEERLDRLADLIARLHAGHVTNQPSLLRGYAALEAYTGKSGRTLRRYKQLMGFPLWRWGRHSYSSVSAIESWLLTVDAMKRRAREEKRGSPPSPHDWGQVMEGS